MKNHTMLAAASAAALFLVSGPSTAAAQTLITQEADTLHISITERNLDGPRLGMSVVPGNGELKSRLSDHGVGRTISQFGWHFEHRVRLQRSGPAFVIEFIPLVGGVEYGKFIPSASLMFGIRFPSGFEFGMGPNLLAGGSSGVSSALVLALGKTFDYDGVSIPVNLAFVTSPIGNRLGLVFGYAI
jgi:hypothetical protein